MVRMCATGRPPLASRKAAVMGVTSVRGSTRLRMIHQSGATLELSAVSRSGICAIGMYMMGERITVGAAIVRIADNANNLPWAFSESWTCARPDLNPVFKRITFGPVMAGHCLIDHNDARHGSIILLGKSAATQQRNFERIEVAPGDGVEACSAGERRVSPGTANHVKDHAETACHRQTIGNANINDFGNCEHTIRTVADHLSNRRCLLEAVATDRHGHADHVVHFKAGVNCLQLEERTDKQGCPDHEHKGECHLAYD